MQISYRLPTNAGKLENLSNTLFLTVSITEITE